MDTLLSKLFEISYGVTRILGEASDSEKAVLRLLHLLGTKLDWDFASLWIVDDAKFVLRCTYTWRKASTPGLEQFEAVSKQREFSLGEGVPGSAWAKRRVEWVVDASEYPNSPRRQIALGAKLTSLVSVPLQSSSGVLGALELASVRQREQEDALINFFHALGGQIGVFLERARLKADVKQLDSQLQILTQLSSDAILTIEEDSTIVFVSSAISKLLGYSPKELQGQKLTQIMPERLRARHEQGIRRYLATGQKSLNWQGVVLPGLHKNGSEVELEIAFDEFYRGSRRIFTGFMRKANL